MKITVLLRKEHEHLRGLFAAFRKPSQTRTVEAKRDLLDEIRRELLIHAQMEREIFYPALGATASRRAVELVSQAEREHASIEETLHELKGLNPAHQEFDETMTRLMDEAERHIETEEEDVFEEVRMHLPEQRLEELGLELEDRRKILVMIAA